MQGHKHGQFEDMEQNESMILEEVIDENYEPTKDEIIEYAQYLGMNLNEDADLLYIAREGLKAPLPDNWKPCKTRDGDIYYFNFATNESQWEHPCDEYFKNKYMTEKRKKSQGTGGGGGGNQGSGSKKVSNFKSKFPTSKNVSNLKPDPLPNLKPGGIIKPGGKKQSAADPYNDIDASFSAEGGTSFSNQPSDNRPGAKSKQYGSQLTTGQQESDLKASGLGASDFANEFEQIDSEFENKIYEVQQQKEKELEKFKKQHNNEYERKANEQKRKMDRELAELQEELSVDMRSSKMEFFEARDKIKKELQSEFDRKYQEEHENLKKDFQRKKMEKDINEDQAIKDEQAKIKELYEDKVKELNQRKSELLAEVDQIKKDEQHITSQVEEKFEAQKRDIISEYEQNLKNLEKDLRSKQSREVQNYKKELKSKLEDEKKLYENAEKQRESMARSRLDDMKSEIQRKLETEKERADDENENLLQAFEETEKARKENDLKKQEQELLKKEREKRKNKVKKDLDDHKEVLDRRLDNYKSILREKFETEKSILDQQADDTISELRREVEDIQVDLSSKEDIIVQINKLQENESELQVEFKSSMLKLSQIDKENQDKQNKLDDLQTQFRQRSVSKSGESKKLLDELMRKSRQLDQQIEKQNRVIKDRQQSIATNSQFENQGLRTASVVEEREGRGMSKNTSFNQHNRSSNSMQKIMKEVTQIKSILFNTYDGKDELHTGQVKRQRDPYENLKQIPPQDTDDDLGFESENGNEVDEYDRLPKTNQEWIDLYHREATRIEKMKDELRNDKLVLKRTQEYLARDQEKFKDEYEDFKLSASKSAKKKQMLKKLRKTLNEQVRKLNDDVYRLRENEFLIQNKERMLPNFKNSIKQFQSKKIDRDQLIAVYTAYAQLEFRYKTPLLREESKLNTMENRILSDRDTKQFYERWKDILENQLTLEFDASDAEFDRRPYTSGTGLGHYDSHDNRRRERPRSSQPKSHYDETIDRLKNEGFTVKQNNYVSGSTASNGYGYDNLIKMLDFQLKANVRDPQNEFVSKQINQSTETRYKLKGVFTDHSQWLSNMKSRLNKHLYEKPNAKGASTSYVFGLV